MHIYTLLSKLVDINNLAGKYSDLYRESIIDIIVLECLNIFPAYNKSAAEQAPSALINSILYYLNINFKNTVTLKELAEYTSYSASYITKVFKEAYGMTIFEYLNDIRLDFAASTLVSNSKMPINELAYECGFNQVPYFVRAFSKKFGITPLQYRKQKLSEQNSAE